MGKSKHTKEFKTEQEIQNDIKRKQYIHDRESMKTQYFKNLNVK